MKALTGWNEKGGTKRKLYFGGLKGGVIREAVGGLVALGL